MSGGKGSPFREVVPSRNDPCPCGSGKKYKKCCMKALEGGGGEEFEDLRASLDELDALSNSVIDLIAARDFDRAEAACKKLLKEYPDQADGIWRLAMLHEARGNRPEAAKCYREAAEFMRTHEGFDEEGITDMLESARGMEAPQAPPATPPPAG
jgi:tetratricopeptide (TPR) repeat protein